MGTKIKRAREAAFLTQVELATKAKLHPVSLARIEMGHTTPRITTVRRLAKALGLTPAELVR